MVELTNDIIDICMLKWRAEAKAISMALVSYAKAVDKSFLTTTLSSPTVAMQDWEAYILPPETGSHQFSICIYYSTEI